jgi:hypothetical protein
VIRLHLRDQAFDVEDMEFEQASRLHSHGTGAFRVSTRPLRGALTSKFRRMSIAVAQVVSVEELP